MVEFNMAFSALSLIAIAGVVVGAIIVVNFVNYIITNAIFKSISKEAEKLIDFYKDLLG